VQHCLQPSIMLHSLCHRAAHDADMLTLVQLKICAARYYVATENQKGNKFPIHREVLQKALGVERQGGSLNRGDRAWSWLRVAAKGDLHGAGIT
jgi:hypothetical protein